MRLVGNYFSPFVRRVAVSLHALHIPFELEEVSVANEPDRVRVHNPVVRIPALLLDSGEVLVESYAILDEIDQIAGPAKALIPPSGPERRRVMQITAIAMASMEKAQWAFYERRFHPEEKVHQPWIDHNDAQAIGGLKYLDEIAAQIAPGGWLANTPAITQADISAAIICRSIDMIRPNLKVKSEAPHLCSFAERCERLPAFVAAPVPAAPPAAKR
jgi:glutathione S-transferase